TAQSPGAGDWRRPRRPLRCGPKRLLHSKATSRKRLSAVGGSLWETTCGTITWWADLDPFHRKAVIEKLVGAVAFVVLTATTVAGQGRSQLYTQPAVPPEEALHRLNLKLAWQVHVPTEGRRDGLFSVQVLEKQVLVQTRGGVVIALDAATG